MPPLSCASGALQLDNVGRGVRHAVGLLPLAPLIPLQPERAGSATVTLTARLDASYAGGQTSGCDPTLSDKSFLINGRLVLGGAPYGLRQT